MSTSPVSSGEPTLPISVEAQAQPVAAPLSYPAGAAYVPSYLDVGFSHATVDRLGIRMTSDSSVSSIVIAEVLAASEEIRLILEGFGSASMKERIRAFFGESGDAIIETVELSEQIFTMAERYQELRSEKEDLATLRAARQGESGALDGPIAGKQSDIAAKLSEIEAAADPGEREALEAELALLQGELAELNGLKEQAENDIAEMGAQILQHEEEMSAIETEMPELAARLEQALRRVEEIQEKIDAQRLGVLEEKQGMLASMHDIFIDEMLENFNLEYRALKQPVHWGMTAEEAATQYTVNGIDLRAAVYTGQRVPDSEMVARVSALSVAAVMEGLSLFEADVPTEEPKRTRLDL